MSIHSPARAVIAFAVLAAGGLMPPIANASPGNGELCSVQSSDGELRASIYAWPITTSSHASQAAIARAGQWCTVQLATPGFVPADNHYDSWAGQLNVWLIHVGTDLIATSVWVDPSSPALISEGEQACNDIADYNQAAIILYPLGS